MIAAQAWAEAVLIAQRVLRDVLDGRALDPTTVGALAERVLAVAASEGTPALGNEGEDDDG